LQSESEYLIEESHSDAAISSYPLKTNLSPPFALCAQTTDPGAATSLKTLLTAASAVAMIGPDGSYTITEQQQNIL